MAKRKSIGSVPASNAEASEKIAKIGDLRRQFSALKASEDAAIAKVKAEHAPKLAEVAEAIESEMVGLAHYAEANRETILPKGMKSVTFPAGVIGWRTTPTKVSVGKGGDKKLLEYLLANRMWQFVRVVREPNKEKLLEKRPAIPGVKYTQKEEFYVNPNDEHSGGEIHGEVLVTM